MSRFDHNRTSCGLTGNSTLPEPIQKRLLSANQKVAIDHQNVTNQSLTGYQNVTNQRLTDYQNVTNQRLAGYRNVTSCEGTQHVEMNDQIILIWIHTPPIELPL
jgi:hypothetical protein